MEVRLASIDKMSGSDLPSYHRKSIFWNRGSRSVWCSPVGCLLLEEDRSADKARIALALASAVACRVLMASASVSTVVLRSVWSPMAAVQENAAAGGEVEREGEDRRDRDTRLSRAFTPRVASLGPSSPARFSPLP